MTTEKDPSRARGAVAKRARRSEKIQLLLVDEHPLLRAGVRTLLENEATMEVVAEAGSVDQAVDACRERDVDVVLMDIDEATEESVDDMRRLRDELPQSGALVVLARNQDDEGVYQAVVGGAAGHVGEDARPDELVDTIQQAAAGKEPIRRTLVSRPQVGRRVLETFARLAARTPVRHGPKLSDRELGILNYAAQGMTNNQIGKELGISEHTVKSALSMTLSRLGLRHRTEAVVYALRNGWITAKFGAEETAVDHVDGRYAKPGF